MIVLIFAIIALLCGTYAMFRYWHTPQSVPQEETLPAPKKPIVVDEEPLDSKYARTNDMWVCQYCETLNPDGVVGGAKMVGDGESCCACGKKR